MRFSTFSLVISYFVARLSTKLSSNYAIYLSARLSSILFFRDILRVFLLNSCDFSNNFFESSDMKI